MERYEQYQTRQPDITGIYQGFRCVGSQSKLGADYPVKAYKMSDNRYTLEDIKDSIPNCKVDLSVLTEKPKKEKSKLSLDEAKKLYPEWYQERVVEGRPKKKGTWYVMKLFMSGGRTRFLPK
jgi:hypothetical protein